MVLAQTNKDGQFVFDIQKELDSLTFSHLGYENLKIKINHECEYFEVILIEDANYDFRTLRKENKVRKTKFDKLPVLYKLAFDKGIFKFKDPCFDRNFVYH